MIKEWNTFAWNNNILSNNIILVKENQTIQQVLDSITDASADNPYTIIIPPGIYEEQIVMKDYVNLQGSGRNATIIKFYFSTFWQNAVVKLAKNVCLGSLSVVSDGDFPNYALVSFDEGDYYVYINDCNLGEEGKGVSALNMQNGGRFIVTNSRIAVIETGCNSFYGEYNLYSCELIKGHASPTVVWQSGKNGSVGRLFNCYVHAEDIPAGPVVRVGGSPTTLFEMYNTKVYATSNYAIQGLYLSKTGQQKGIVHIYGGSIEVQGAEGSKDIVNGDEEASVLNVYGTKYNTASGIIGGTNRQQGRSIVLSSHSTFGPEDGNIFKLTTDGNNNYNFNPTGTFTPWTRITVINADDNNTITFDSTGLNLTIQPGQSANVIYDGNQWLQI